MTETTLQAIHFKRAAAGCRMPVERMGSVMQNAMMTGWLDGLDKEICVAVGTVDGSVCVFKRSLGERMFTELSGIGW